ncbi:acyl-CoA thioesterase FadM [Anaerospora hongkongensis]|uniref:Acyl-coenzyme A thioesterase THEM4 n=1 Tax=Anaerospora hongkongensis TaxID=244830 RepID=A0A4R1PX27_9FIRM|nr:PaaI family thioesterase [Anaerospora hongkongensis]TCL36228.1 acyl-CoA thioesterase FadM [Anaerospora hongkongensis]
MEDRDSMCFVCGPKNPIGLKLQFREENGQYMTEFTAGQEHQSYDGIVHGGLVSTVLDEVMARYIYAKGLHAVTARLEVRYRQPTPIEQPLTVVGWITRERGKLYELAGEIRLADGTVTADGKATVVLVQGE